MARSPNSHTLKMRAFAFVARLWREDPFRSADAAEWHAKTVGIADGPDHWYSWAKWMQDFGFKQIGFPSQAEAEAMQC